MAKTSVRLEPVGKADIAGRGRHNSRTGYIPENVDPSRTAFNVPLIGDDACEAIWQDIAGLDQARAGRREIVCAEVISSFPTELLGKVSSGAKGAIECLSSPDLWHEQPRRILHGWLHFWRCGFSRTIPHSSEKKRKWASGKTPQIAAG